MEQLEKKDSQQSQQISSTANNNIKSKWFFCLKRNPFICISFALIVCSIYLFFIQSILHVLNKANTGSLENFGNDSNITNSTLWLQDWMKMLQKHEKILFELIKTVAVSPYSKRSCSEAAKLNESHIPSPSD